MARQTVIVAVAGGLVGLLVWSAGCSSTQTKPPPEVAKPASAPIDSVVMALSFKSGQTTTYKLTTQTERRAEYSGNVPQLPEQLQGGRTGNQIRMVFDQHVESVDADGNAILKITIKSLTYVGRSRDKVVLDFDGSRPADSASPLAKLIGQGYTLKMSPSGEVLAVTDVQPVRAAVVGSLPANQTAQKLLSDEVVKERHRLTALMAAQKKTVHKGDTWDDLKVVPFQSMGTITLQQIYKLVAVEQDAGRQVAIVEMEAIPSAAIAEQLHQQSSTPVNPGILSNSQEDKGRLRLDLTNQRIDECTEDRVNEWMTMLAGVDSRAGLATMKMTAVQRYRLERVE